jgi:Double zinc ribbon domain
MMQTTNRAAILPVRLREIGRAIVDIVLPPRCLACGRIVGEPDSLCGRCWSPITFFSPPYLFEMRADRAPWKALSLCWMTVNSASRTVRRDHPWGPALPAYQLARVTYPDKICFQ